MNDALLHDLDSFERHELSRDDLVIRHGAEAGAVLTLHDRITALRDAPPFDVDAGWARVAASIAPLAPLAAVSVPDPEPAPERRQGSVHAARGSRSRMVALGVAAAMMLAGSAFAVIGPRFLGGRQAILPPAAGVQPIEGAGPRGGGHPPAGFSWTGPGEGPSGATGAAGSPDGTSSGSTSTGSGTGHGGWTGHDSSSDTDKGKGNDGSHGDQGAGNDTSGTGATPTHGSHD